MRMTIKDIARLSDMIDKETKEEKLFSIINKINLHSILWA